jgi:large subunit ribosomal protein L3
MQAILGKKLTMSQADTSDGRRVPITRVQAGPATVTAVKDAKTDGYVAVQLGFGTSKRLSKALSGHLKAAKVAPVFIKEIKLDKPEEVSVGQVISADVFSAGEVVDVTSIAKGKGFAGGMKRHGFHGGPKTHGQSDRSRAPGSIGSSTTPGRVMKGKHMAGRMGGGQITTQGLEIIGVEKETGVMLIKGAIPGPTGAFLVIRHSDKKRKVYHGPQAQALPHKDEALPVTGEVATTSATTSTAPVPTPPAATSGASGG